MEYEYTASSQSEVYLHVIIDTGFPMNKGSLMSCLSALENVLIWASNLQAKPISPFYGVSLINSSVQHVIKPMIKQKSPSSNFSQAHQLKRLLSLVKTYPEVSSQEFGDVLHLAINETLRDLFTRLRPGIGTFQQHFILISPRKGQQVVDKVHKIRNSAIGFGDVRSFQVVELLAEDTCMLLPVISQDGVPPPLPLLLPRLEAALQRVWGQLLRPAALPLQLELPSPHALPAISTFQCQATPCLLNPLWLPSWAWDRFLLDGPPLQGSGGGSGSPKPTRLRLSVVKRVASDNVCEASLFGLPLQVTAAVLRPEAYDVDQWMRNSQMFTTLCRTLLARDECLIAKVLRGAPEDFGGYFVIMPGNDDSLMLKSIASAELLLPTLTAPLSHAAVTERFKANILECLDAIPSTANFRAEDFLSGLYSALNLNVHFPTPRSCGCRDSSTLSIVTDGSARILSSADGGTERESRRQSEMDCGPGHPTLEETFQSAATRSSRPAPRHSALEETFQSAVPSSRPAPADERLGTGGHPALEETFQSAAPPSSRPAPGHSALEETFQSAALSSRPAPAPAGRLGTGGHPALEETFQSGARSKRRKAQLPVIRL